MLSCAEGIFFVVIIAVSFMLIITFAWFFERSQRVSVEKQVRQQASIIVAQREVMTTKVRLNRAFAALKEKR